MRRHHADHDPGEDAHGHDHGKGHGHTHAHGIVDPSIVSSDRGLWALKWSFVGLMVTAAIQTGVVLVSGSVALLADTIHNFADAATAIPLGVAFWLARRGATPRFTYGLGRVEDLAGLAIIVTILASALAATYAAIHRLLHPEPVALLWAVMVASVIGFIGNEAVAIFRIRVGRQIGSAALIADGYHARIDGWTSLAVLVGAIAVWAGYPLADPVVGLLISIAIFVLVWQSAGSILLRTLDGVETQALQDIVQAAGHVPGVTEVTDVRARWIGHRLHADLCITDPGALSVGEGHEVAKAVRHQLLHPPPHLGSPTVHCHPDAAGGARVGGVTALRP